MNWRFWRRASSQGAGKRDGSEAEFPKQQNAAAEHVPGVNGLQMSSKELLGLQRIIGNQAVIQMLKPRDETQGSGKEG